MITHHFIGYFLGEPQLAGCPLQSLSLFVLELCILSGQIGTFHILNTIPPCLSGISSVSDSVSLHCESGKTGPFFI